MIIAKYRRSGLIGEDEEIQPEELKEIVAAFAQTETYLFKVHAGRLQGKTEIDSDLQHRLLEKWNKDKIIKKDVGIPLSQLLTEYAAQWQTDNLARIIKKKKECCRIAESFDECFGKVLGVHEVTG